MTALSPIRDGRLTDTQHEELTNALYAIHSRLYDTMRGLMKEDPNALTGRAVEAGTYGHIWSMLHAAGINTSTAIDVLQEHRNTKKRLNWLEESLASLRNLIAPGPGIDGRPAISHKEDPGKHQETAYKGGPA